MENLEKHVVYLNMYLIAVMIGNNYDSQTFFFKIVAMPGKHRIFLRLPF